MNKIVKRIGIISASFLFIASTVSSSMAFANDDNISYKFNLKPKYGNNYTTSRYRQTPHKLNPWKVNMTYSEEGAGTVATYWLAKSNKIRVSDTHDVKQGSGAHYYSANATASKTNVCLGAENNNNSANSFTVAGYWDEETW